MTDSPEWSDTEKWAFLVARHRSELLGPMWEWADDPIQRLKTDLADDPAQSLKDTVSDGFTQLDEICEAPRPVEIGQYEAQLVKILDRIVEADVRYVETQEDRYKRGATSTRDIPEPVTAAPFQNGSPPI